MPLLVGSYTTSLPYKPPQQASTQFAAALDNQPLDFQATHREFSNLVLAIATRSRSENKRSVDIDMNQDERQRVEGILKRIQDEAVYRSTVQEVFSPMGLFGQYPNVLSTMKDIVIQDLLARFKNAPQWGMPY